MGKKISPTDLIAMDELAQDHPIRIQLAYKHDAPPNIFGKIYHDAARLWLHKDLAQIVVRAAETIYKQNGLYCILYDGLRTVEAQERMRKSDIARQNPHWLEEPGRLLSPPGAGAHPRGMAIDLSLMHADGTLVDMGTDFDYLAQKSAPEHNPAHRAHPHLDEAIKSNRTILDNAMNAAAQHYGFALLPLPQEWWDFRFPAEIYNAYDPLSDAELPPEMRMCDS